MQKEKNQLSDEDLENLRKFNWADYKLYNYFKNKLKLEVEKLGKEKVEKVKNEIIHESRRLSRVTQCPWLTMVFLRL